MKAKITARDVLQLGLEVLAGAALKAAESDEPSLDKVTGVLKLLRRTRDGAISPGQALEHLDQYREARRSNDAAADAVVDRRFPRDPAAASADKAPTASEGTDAPPAPASDTDKTPVERPRRQKRPPESDTQ